MTIEICRCQKTDAEVIAAIEALCFPAAEAAPYEVIVERLALFPDSFLAAKESGQIIGFINGCVTDQPIIDDALFTDSSKHLQGGRYQAIFGLDVLPAYRRQGVGALLMNAFIQAAKDAGRAGVILTCKEALLPYYASFGYQNKGRSQSVHGGAIWYDMLLPISVI